jgi:hypothetical protein
MGYGHLSPEYQAYMRSPQWDRLKRLVWNRAGGRCERCGRLGGQLDVHHKTYEHFRCERLNELELLCREPCHRLADAERQGRVMNLDELDRAVASLNRTIDHYSESRAHVVSDDGVVVTPMPDDGGDDDLEALRRAVGMI